MNRLSHSLLIVRKEIFVFFWITSLHIKNCKATEDISSGKKAINKRWAYVFQSSFLSLWKSSGLTSLPPAWRGFSRSILSDSFVAPWTIAYRALLSMGFSRQEHWSGLPFPSPDIAIHWNINKTTNNSEILMHAINTTWMNPENRMLSGRSQSQKATYCTIPFIWNVQSKSIRTENRLGFA